MNRQFFQVQNCPSRYRISFCHLYSSLDIKVTWGSHENDGVVCFTKEEHREHPLPSSKSCSTFSVCGSCLQWTLNRIRDASVCNEAKGFIFIEHGQRSCHGRMYTMTIHVMRRRTHRLRGTGSTCWTRLSNVLFLC